MGELEDLRAEVESLKANMLQVQQRTMDHSQRFETLQSWWWKRLWWWAWQGWSWHDLNAEMPGRRPWRRSQLVVEKEPCDCGD